MEFFKTELPGVIIVKPQVIADQRGYFMESYHVKKFKKNDIDVEFVQDNYAQSVNNTLRGLHFQKRYPQAKLIKCTKGKIFDVAVDIRKDSPFFKRWFGVELSEKNKVQLFIPAGFAHGYCVLSDIAEISYKCSEVYYPEFDYSIKWNDPDIGIKWPIQNPILSEKDHQARMLSEFEF